MVIANKMLAENSMDVAQTINALRVRFVPGGSESGEIYCRFSDPSPVVAVGESVRPFAMSPCWPEPMDQIEILTTGDSRVSAEKVLSWAGAPDHPAASATVLVKKGDLKVRWRPGRAVVQGSIDDCKALLPGLIEFGFYEAELRKLEQAVQPFEATVSADVGHAYEMTPKHQPHWDRLYRTMEQLYRLRLQFARLEPRLSRSSAALPAESRQLFERLAEKADVAQRLEAVSNRLETCEDLYEGAIDRITDYKAYRRGNFLEITIVILLALETALLVLQPHFMR